MWYLQCFFHFCFFQNVLYCSPCVLHNRWNENMAVKRDAQYIIKGYDLKTKSRREFHFSCSSSLTKVCSPCFCLWLKATVSPQFKRPDSSYFDPPVVPNSTHVVVAFLQTRVLFLAQWMTQNKKPIHSTVQVYKDVWKLQIHTYAQVQDSRCIAHLWQNWVLAVKTNGRGSRNEVPNYLILKEKKSAGKQKQILPRYCAYRSLIFRLVTKVGTWSGNRLWLNINGK